MALRHRETNGGKGQVVDVALYEAVFAMMESLVPEFDVYGFVRERTGNVMPGITPSNTHTTRDGKHVIIGANGDAIFRRLMLAIGRADLANDPELADNAGRDARAAEIYGVIDTLVGAHDAEDGQEELSGLAPVWASIPMRCCPSWVIPKMKSQNCTNLVRFDLRRP